MRVLITGASGFAGGWLSRECTTEGDEVIGASRTGAIPADAGEGVSVDLSDAGAVADLIRDRRPEVVYHLAALSSVGRSWEAPAQTLAGNVGGAVNLLEAIRTQQPQARVVWVSSCEVYGAPMALPTPEDAAIAPANPYAVSKAAGEMLAGVYARAHGIRLSCARPFSHSGPGQRPLFLLSNLSRQGAEGRRAGVSRLRITIGNPDTRRDFTDVRDIARAYRAIASLPCPEGSFDIYNVSSGRSVSASEQVQTLAGLIAPIEVEQVVDPNRVRASEVMELRGDHSRLTAATGWAPRIPFAQTMADTISWWESELAAGGG